MSTANATIAQTLTILETASAAEAPGVSAANRVLRHDQFNLASAAVSPCTKGGAGNQTLSGGAKTIDLTAFVTPFTTLDLTGLKVSALQLVTPASNAGNITIEPGASNGYNYAGANCSLTMQPGQSINLSLGNLTPAVASGAKTIDLAGTGTDVLQMGITAG